MFYSHEVLTSRKYGVATIWLVATLGSKSTLKKVSRKSIQEVNVPKACKTITTPDVPMALRLQSNLLCGVARVYSQQCNYLLQDAQHMHSSMRTMITIFANAELDQHAGRVKPDQLLLPDDPSFLPDFSFKPPVLDIDIDLSTPPSDPGFLSSLSSSHTSNTSIHHGGLVFASSDSSGAEIGGLMIGSGRDHSFPALEERPIVEEDDGFLPDVDFTFDAEGNLLEAPIVQTTELISRTPSRPLDPQFESEINTSARVRREHEGGFRARINIGARTDEEAMIPFGDDFGILPDAEPFPTHHDHGFQHIQIGGQEIEVDSEFSTSATAPMRRHRKKTQRVIPIDQTMELRNSDLINWNSDYLQNMEAAKRVKMQHKSVSIAKKNAYFLVWGRGIANVGTLVGETSFTAKHPLAMFAGDRLFENITGLRISKTTPQKRSHASGDEDIQAEDDRRVRPRSEETDNARRGIEALHLRDEEDAAFLPVLDDADVEIPRDAPSALAEDNLSSAMPWNITASARGSSIARSHSILPIQLGGTMSAGGPSSVGGMSFIGGTRRGSRLISASPLLGRGTVAANPEPMAGTFPLEDNDEIGLSFDDNNGLLGDVTATQFELYGPAAAVDTQTAGQSQWSRDTLDVEGTNFLEFIENAIEKKRNNQMNDNPAFNPALANTTINDIAFAELLPPKNNSHVVAAQGFLHTLSLATKSLLQVQQEVAFGEIVIAVQ